MSTDLRGFSYALEPLLRRRRWELEGLQARLGEANREIAEVVRVLEALHEQLAEQSARAGDAIAQRMDPALHRRSLQWLARSREAIARGQEALKTLRDTRSRLMAEYLVQQNKLSVIERDREERLAGYAQEHQNRAAAAADGDWLARCPSVLRMRPRRAGR